MVATLEFRAGAISGLLGGKSLRCLVRALAGSRPSPGLYHILPPVRDVFYGPVALMTPADMAPGPGAVSFPKAQWPGGVSQKVDAPGGVSQKVDAPGAISGAKIEGPSGLIGAKGWVGGKVTHAAKDAAGASLSHTVAPTFILSAQPVPGRHCLVIESNFADLLEALYNAGGGAIRVA